MTRDDYYQVVYKCSVCSREKQIDDTNLAIIAEAFENLGWGNVPEYHHGKTAYTVYCPKCYENLYKINSASDEDALDTEHKLWTDSLNEQDMERPGLFH